MYILLYYVTGSSIFKLKCHNLSKSTAQSPRQSLLILVLHKDVCYHPSCSFSLQTTLSPETNPNSLFLSDDATLVGCLENADEMAYREEVQCMVGWCWKNNLVLNVSKTCEMTIDFQKQNSMCQFLIDNTLVKQVDSF